jgi:hypothetical protein
MSLEDIKDLCPCCGEKGQPATCTIRLWGSATTFFLHGYMCQNPFCDVREFRERRCDTMEENPQEKPMDFV